MPANRKVSNVQIEELLLWMEGHPLMARSTLQPGSQGRRSSVFLWEDLASKLNSIGSGSSKTWKEWRQYWNDQKCKVRKKGSLLLQHSRGTGGGPASSNILSPVEEQILSLIGVQNIIGNQNVRLDVDMGLDEEPEPVQAEPEAEPEPVRAEPEPDTEPITSSYAATTPQYLKRKHKRLSNGEDSPMEKTRRLGPPQWALELEERRLDVEKTRLEEERQFRQQMIALQRESNEDQRKFHGALLSTMDQLVKAMTLT